MAGNESEKDNDEQADVAQPKLSIAYPSRDSDGFAIVGVGASAGGLEAFSQLLRAMPKEPGLAIVFVQHMSPNHESALAELLTATTNMPVLQPSQDVELEVNHVYVMPPNGNLVLKDGMLHVQPRPTDRSQYTPIDTLFQSMAEQLGPAAIGVILSGTASDGVEGVHAIRAAGGIAIVQSPETAKQDGMPRAAIATGEIDLVLSPVEMAGELVRLAQQSPGGYPHSGRGEVPLLQPEQLEQIFSLLRTNSGVDFGHYKLPTLQRRIQRRMTLRKVASGEDYIKLLRDNPSEISQLYQDVLIHVTSFFRDAEAFKVLAEEVFPSILASRRDNASIRIWVPACSTGEEPYSVAITLVECLEQRSERVPIQIFATDVSEIAVEQARAGLFPPSLVERLSPERLRRFFTKADGHYRINKTIRDLCVFARHDLTRDPPFSNLDLIVCRNVLIYLGPAVQWRLISLFHYSLKAAGYLMMGTAETIGPHGNLFRTIDKKNRIYRKTAADTPSNAKFTFQQLRPAAGYTPASATEHHGAGTAESEVNRLILDRYSPPGVLVNEELRIMQFRGKTGRFLELAPGDASLNLLKMCREGLLHGLRTALQTAKKSDQPVRREGLRVKANGDFINVTIEVVPLVTASQGRHYLILFQEVGPASPQPVAAAKKGRTKGARGKDRKQEDSDLERLQKELIANREYLQAIIHDLEAANEELQSANEEILSSNEELQSTNEELDTAKEELESTNEELNTLNEELHGRNEELARTNSDLMNLLHGVQMAIVIVASDLRIRRFTPMAEKVLNLIPGDVGRPIGQIKPNINCPNLEKLILEVIDLVAPLQRDVQDAQGRTYSLTIRPYKNVDNRIEGAVLMLYDIDAIRRHADEAQEAREYAEAIFNAARNPLVVLDDKLRVERVNIAFSKLFRSSDAEVRGRTLYDVIGGQWNHAELRKLLEEVVPRGSHFEDFELDHRFDGAPKKLRLGGRRITASDNRPALILLTIEEIG